MRIEVNRKCAMLTLFWVSFGPGSRTINLEHVWVTEENQIELPNRSCNGED